MPTIMRIGALRVVVYPNDHRPPHVHVIGGGGEAVFEFHTEAGTVALWETFGFSRTQLVRIATALETEIPALSAGWESVHGAD